MSESIELLRHDWFDVPWWAQPIGEYRYRLTEAGLWYTVARMNGSRGLVSWVLAGHRAL